MSHTRIKNVKHVDMSCHAYFKCSSIADCGNESCVSVPPACMCLSIFISPSLMRRILIVVVGHSKSEDQLSPKHKDLHLLAVLANKYLHTHTQIFMDACIHV